MCMLGSCVCMGGQGWPVFLLSCSSFETRSGRESGSPRLSGQWFRVSTRVPTPTEFSAGVRGAQQCAHLLGGSCCAWNFMLWALSPALAVTYTALLWWWEKHYHFCKCVDSPVKLSPVRLSKYSLITVTKERFHRGTRTNTNSWGSSKTNELRLMWTINGLCTDICHDTCMGV